MPFCLRFCVIIIGIGIPIVIHIRKATERVLEELGRTRAVLAFLSHWRALFFDPAIFPLVIILIFLIYALARRRTILCFQIGVSLECWRRLHGRHHAVWVTRLCEVHLILLQCQDGRRLVLLDRFHGLHHFLLVDGWYGRIAVVACFEERRRLLLLLLLVYFTSHVATAFLPNLFCGGLWGDNYHCVWGSSSSLLSSQLWSFNLF